MRTFLRTAAATAAALLLLLGAAGCNKTDATSDAGPTTTALGQVPTRATVVPDDEGAPREGGKLVFGLDAASDGVSPVGDTLAINAHMIASAVFDPLAVADKDRKVKPYLAEAITANTDATVWTIKLRPNVTFHNGKPCDAEAVAANIRAQKAGIPSVTLKPIQEIAVVDPLTVEVRMNQPWAAYDWVLTSQEGYVAEPSTLPSSTAGTAPVGTGPFRMDDWGGGTKIVMHKYDRYWQPNKPHLDELDFVVLADPGDREGSLRKGTVDLVMTNESSTIAEYVDKPGFVLVQDPTGDVNTVVLNSGKAPFDNEHARKAIAYATNQKALLDEIGNGVFPAADQPYPPGSPYHVDDAKALPTDTAKAKAEVAAYTNETGQPLSFTFMANDDTLGLKTAQILSDMWTAVGAQVTVDAQDQKSFIPKLISGGFDAAQIGNFGFLDPDWNYLFWHSSFVAPIGQLSINFSHTNDPAMDAALDTGRTTKDPAVRAKAYQTVAQRLNEDVAYVYLYRANIALIAREGVHGLGYAERAGFGRTDAKPWVADLWVTKK